MKNGSRIVMACGAALALAAFVAPVAAQATLPDGTCAKTRAEVRDECIDFMKKHRWDEASSNWVLKSGEKPPEGVKSREEIRAERDAFFKANRWNEAKSTWEPITGEPRNLATMSRQQMRAETAAFMRTHRWDEATGQYVDRKR